MTYDPQVVLDAIAADLAAVEAEHGLPPERCGLVERVAHPTVAARLRAVGREAIARAHLAGVSAVYEEYGVLVEAMPDGTFGKCILENAKDRRTGRMTSVSISASKPQRFRK